MSGFVLTFWEHYKRQGNAEWMFRVLRAFLVTGGGSTTCFLWNGKQGSVWEKSLKSCKIHFIANTFSQFPLLLLCEFQTGLCEWMWDRPFSPGVQDIDNPSTCSLAVLKTALLWHRLLNCRDGTIHLPPDSILSWYLGAVTICIAKK